jgi:hypothetical protein
MVCESVLLVNTLPSSGVKRPAATAVVVVPLSITESVTVIGPFGDRKYGRQTSGVALGAAFKLIALWLF